VEKEERRTKEEECGISMYDQDKGSQWYIYSGCLKHMTRN